jgi:hypothetical protein
MGEAEFATYFTCDRLPEKARLSNFRWQDILVRHKMPFSEAPV